MTFRQKGEDPYLTFALAVCPFSLSFFRCSIALLHCFRFRFTVLCQALSSIRVLVAMSGQPKPVRLAMLGSGIFAKVSNFARDLDLCREVSTRISDGRGFVYITLLTGRYEVNSLNIWKMKFGLLYAVELNTN